MRLIINGEARQWQDGDTVSDLLVSLEIDPKGAAVEKNGEIVPRSEHGEAGLVDGDRIEIVKFIGGG